MLIGFDLCDKTVIVKILNFLIISKTKEDNFKDYLFKVIVQKMKKGKKKKP